METRPKPFAFGQARGVPRNKMDLEERVATLESHCFPDAGRQSRLVYVGMAADILHHGHVNILKVAARYGRVVVGLLTDEAITSYKRVPKVGWDDRCRLVEHLRGVHLVVPQTSHDYRPNLRLLRPSFVVHGSDWKEGPQAKTREQVIECLKEWGGKLVEPEYTSVRTLTPLNIASPPRAPPCVGAPMPMTSALL